MDFLSILKFLSPISSLSIKTQILPIIFFIVIWGLFAYTIFQVYRNAQSENWEHNWYGGNKNNSSHELDAEHSSVMEISDAVATTAEKRADMMPGIILIIGLLGTFLGLGLALDNASSILGNANMSQMDSSMAELMTMLEGLGTKFKTSTWGLLAFLTLKMILSKNGYEDRRLRWSIEKIKKELEIVREHKKHVESLNNKNIIDCMQDIALKFERALNINQTTSIQQLEQSNLDNKNALARVAEQSFENHQAGFKLMQQFSQNVNTHSAELLNEVQQFQATSLSVLKDQSEMFNNQLNGLNEKTAQANDLISVNHKENKSLLNKIVMKTAESSDAIQLFVQKNEATVAMLGKSAAGMSKAASTMGDSATHLQIVINNFRENMEEVVSMMKTDLNSTINGMNTSFSENMTFMSSNLSNSISEMSLDFKSNMSSMSQGLGQATSDISEAVNSLSVNVKNTMDSVQTTIGKSMDLQTKAQSVFITSTDSLNDYIQEMTGLVNKLSDDITGGLKAVSESNRNMISLAKRTEKQTETVDQYFNEFLVKIESLQQLGEFIESYNQNALQQQAVFKSIDEHTQYLGMIKSGGILSTSLSELKKNVLAQQHSLKEIAINTSQLKNSNLEQSPNKKQSRSMTQELLGTEG